MTSKEALYSKKFYLKYVFFFLSLKTLIFTNPPGSSPVATIYQPSLLTSIFIFHSLEFFSPSPFRVYSVDIFFPQFPFVSHSLDFFLIILQQYFSVLEHSSHSLSFSAYLELKHCLSVFSFPLQILNFF